MKSKTLTSLAALLALSSAGVASAQTIVHVTGSTAFRAAVLTAEVNSLKAGGTVNAAYFNTATAAASLVTSGISIVYGPGTATSRVIFENNFNGSIGGLFDVSNSTHLTYPSPTYYDPANGTVKATPVTASATGSGNPPTPGTNTTVPGPFNDGYNTGSSSVPAAGAVSAVPDATLSDVFLDTAQTVVNSVSPGQGVGTPTAFTTTVNGTKIAAVGIVPFVFVASNGTPAGLTNMTAQIFNQLYSAGTVKLSFFTGGTTTTDTGTTIYAVGRDLDSGTRATAFAETNFGVGTAPTQYFPYDSTGDANNDTATGVVGNSGSGKTVAAFNVVPDQTLSNGLTEFSPNGGYASGGNLAVASRSANTSGGYFVTYLGLVDAGSSLAGTTPGRTLSYAGNSLLLTAGTLNTDGSVSGGGNFSDGATSASKIEQGQYTFWGYEHLFYGSSLSTAQTNAVTALGNDLSGGDDMVSSGGPNGVTLSGMKVQRSDDGATVQPL